MKTTDIKLYGNTECSLIRTCSPRRRYMSQEMSLYIILILTTYRKTHLISQRLSLNMPRMNQNQRIQALTTVARGDNVSNVIRAFGCHSNTIIRLRQRFQQTGGVADRRRPGRPRVTNPRTDRFITLTHLRRRFQTATSSAGQYGISK